MLNGITEAFRILPDRVVLNVLPLLYKHFGKGRRTSSVSFSTENGLCKAYCHATNENFYFIEARRCPRYIRNEGIFWRMSKMLEKYGSSDVAIDVGDVVLDVGANVGEFAVAAAKMAGKVWCFEPDESCLPALKKNAMQIKKIHVIPLAVCESSGKAEFFQSTSTADSSTIKPASYSEVKTVDAISLDDFSTKNNISTIDFLKIEAEGAEPEVLKGATKLLSAGRIRKIAIDAGPERHGLPTGSMVKQILSSYGYIVTERGYIVFARKMCVKPSDIAAP